MIDQASPWRRPAAALNLVGAGLFLAGLALTPWETEHSTAGYHDALAGSPDQSVVAAIVLHFSYVCLAGGAFALIGVLGGSRSWWLRIGAVLVLLGATTMPGLLVTDAYDLALAQELSRDVSTRVSDAAGDTAITAVLGMTAMLGLVVGPLLVWVAAWRERVVPGSVPALVLVSWIVGFATMDPPVMFAGAAILIVAAGLAAAHLWWPRADRTTGGDGVVAEPAPAVA